MATSSLALKNAGLIDPTKPATYRVILGEDIRSNSGDPAEQTFTGIRYNFKPKHLTDKSTQRSSTLTSKNSNDGDFDITFRDNSGGRYVFAGTRVSKGSKYVLVFDSKKKEFILHRLDSLFVMNMTDTPTNHDVEALKKKYPHIDENTKRPRPSRGAAQLVRRPAAKKSAGPLRPMQKPAPRPTPRPTPVLRNSHEIKKKDKRVSLAVPDQAPDRETKAAKEVRESREAIVVKEARDSRDPRDKASNDVSPITSPSAVKTKAAAGDSALQKSKSAALSARPKEGSKLSKETKASPDTKARDRDDLGDKLKAKTLDAKGKEVKASPLKEKGTIEAKTRLPGQPRDDKASTAKSSDVRTGKDKDSKSKDAAARAKTVGGAGTSKASTKQTSKAKAAPPPLPMPEAPPAPASKKKRRDWEDEDEEDDDGDIGLVIEYPEGPAVASRTSQSSAGSVASGGGSNKAHAASSTPQLHMRTFDEFQRANALGDEMEEMGSEDDMDGYWDPSKDESASAPAMTIAKDKSKATSSSSGGAAPAAAVKSAPTHAKGKDEDEIDELEEALLEELQEEEEEQKKRDAELEAELEAEFMAESESEISEEE